MVNNFSCRVSQKKWPSKLLLKSCISFFVIFLLTFSLGFLLPLRLFAEDETTCSLEPPGRYPLMHPDRQTLEKWVSSYQRAPQVFDASFKGVVSRGSLSLLPYLQYTPAQRDQGSCGNCWAWAGTGCMEIALSVQNGIKDRLSVQYLNSCDTFLRACNGGWLSDVVTFYNSTKKAIPWSNTNAQYIGGYSPVCSLISTTPNYTITSISEGTVTTQGVTQAQAIANIKGVLNQGKAVWFGFFLPTWSAWYDFFDFWDYQNESTVYNVDKFSGTYQGGGGHAVLCVGYDDTDPNNSYWVMLNSWGTTSGRPNGLFRVNMNINYSHVNSPYYTFYWQNLNMQYSTNVSVPVLNSITLSDKTDNSTTTTDEREIKVTISATNNPSQAILSEESNFSGASWQTFSSTILFTLSQAAGSKTVYCKVKNSAGESNVVSSTINYNPQAGPPVLTSFSLSAQDTGSTTVTADRTVNFTLSATNSPTQMIISEKGNFKNARWQTYSESGTFILSEKTGNKTVYLKVKNTSGESSRVQASINYNPQIKAPQITSFSLSAQDTGSTTVTADRTVNFALSATNSPTQMIISEKGNFGGARWQTYSESGTFILSKKEGNKTVYIKVKNSYGQSSRVQFSISYNPTIKAPAVTFFDIYDTSSNSNWITNSRTIRFEVTADRDPTQMKISESSRLSGAKWRTYSSNGQFQLSKKSGLKYVYVRLKNGYGESSTAAAYINYSPGYLEGANQVPQFFKIKNPLNGSEKFTNTGEVQLVFEESSVSGVQVAEGNERGVEEAVWQNCAAPFRFQLSPEEGEKIVYARVPDASGLAGKTGSARIILDRTAPEVEIKIDDFQIISGDRIKNIFEIKGIFKENYVVNPGSIRIYLDGQQIQDEENILYDSVTQTVSYKLKEKLAEGVHSLKIMVADAAGNEGSGQLNDLKVSEQLILDKVMNYPNPFNQTTNFSYELSREAAVVIRVYTIRGQLVKTLHATAGDSGGQVGFNKVSWNGAAEDGRALPNGMYLYFIEARDSEGRLATARGKAGILR